MVKNEDRFIDLNRLSTRILEGGQELLVDRDELGKERDGLEASARLLRGLAEGEEGDRTSDDRTSGDTEVFGLTVLLESLVEVELEFSLLGKLGDNEVVVRVEPG